MPPALVCRACGATSDDAAQRFCVACGMPLSPSGEAQAPSELRRRARKIDPSYARGELVKVGWARNQAEAELMAGLLLEEGIPSVIRRARGFDVPDFLAAGPRDVLVATSGADAARELLGERGGTGAAAPPSVRSVGAALLVIGGVLLVIAVAVAALL